MNYAVSLSIRTADAFNQVKRVWDNHQKISDDCPTFFHFFKFKEQNFCQLMIKLRKIDIVDVS